MSILDKLDGKKSILGGAALFLALVLEEVVGGIWGYSAPWLSPAIQTFQWVGGLLFPGGLIHKMVKANGNKK